MNASEAFLDDAIARFGADRPAITSMTAQDHSTVGGPTAVDGWPRFETRGLSGPEALIEAYRRMVRIRRFEEAASKLFKATEIPGFVHLSIGQEASATGICWPLRDSDVITSTHRGHGHCIAKGLDSASMMAELFGKETGTCKGRGGSMHIADPRIGIFGANGIVGAGMPIAGGAAHAARSRGNGDVAVAFFGDGAIGQGMFHEAANLAAVWKLPLILACENNGYSEFSSFDEQNPVPVAARALAYGIEHVVVDGNDVVAVATAMSDLLERVRAGGGPAILETVTYRWHGHYEGDPERYREAEEIAAWRAKDPLVIARARMLETGTPQVVIDEIDGEVAAEIERAVRDARVAHYPDPATLDCFVLAPEGQARAEQAFEPYGVYRTMDAVSEALADSLEEDPSVFVVGIDVGRGGNVFGLTRGLVERFPGRLLDTPISEMAIMGVGVGAAMAGMRPVVELMYMDFLGVCLDQLLNQAAKLPFMTGGGATVPMVMRTQFGAGRSSGSQHSQSLEALLAHIPGLTVVMPSTPADTYGLLRSAIESPNPVVFVENRLLYGRQGPKPPSTHRVPLGKAAVVREGTDLTVVSYSRILHDCLTAAEQLSAEGISVEVIDLRTVAPIDRDTILTSLAKTSKLAIVHEASQEFGIGAEIAAMSVDEGFWLLDAPVVRIATPRVPAPYAPSLEKAWLPGVDAIAAKLRKLAQF